MSCEEFNERSLRCSSIESTYYRQEMLFLKEVILDIVIIYIVRAYHIRWYFAILVVQNNTTRMQIVRVQFFFCKIFFGNFLT